MERLKYWVWLTTKQYITPQKITNLLEHFDDVEEIYNADVFDYIEGIDVKEKRELLNKSLDKAEKIIEKMNILGARIITYEDSEYPKSLKKITPPPYVLYMKGKEIDWENSLPIGVIGARICSDYGKVASAKLCYELATAGVTIVSGMARGIDSRAAIAALKAGGETVAVLGCGLDIVYPPENEELMKAIFEHGLVITEYPPSCPPLAHNFPQRNRIISGLSKGILVIEAGRHSGTEITVERAKEYGKDIFAVPGGIFHKESEGTNEMIKRGAVLTTSVRDVFEYYPNEASMLKRAGNTSVEVEIREPEQKKKKSISKKTEQMKDVKKVLEITIDDKRFSGLNEKEKNIISLLLNRNMHIDELVRESGMAIAELNSVLPVLEMMGHIVKMSGNVYKVNIE